MRFRICILALILLYFPIGSSLAASDLEDSLLTKAPPQKTNSIILSNMTIMYTADKAALSDTIEFRKNKLKRRIPGPWSHYSNLKKTEILNCLKEGEQTCLEIYSLGSVHPSGKALELHMQALGKEGWIFMLSTGKVLYSNDTGIQDSTWSTSGIDQYAWVTAPCIHKSCRSKSGVYMTTSEKFSKPIKISEIDEYSLGYKVMFDTENLYVLAKKTRTVNTVSVYSRKTGKLVKKL